ncbi:HAD-IIA family hydrolase [Rhodospira trueperi]|uniref:Haloacid Dehalogenase Superfamily Class (Subfamily) IIA n=1 Tax=Rhodospira trueperi TaxID=69960 RepID=A0A1G6XDT4_9PROT|nr:HAD family hydrolase [Rhodospira trueperi]SDD76404.1 Haloacid Dehalogenase Superfamily Class (subfamily) IIA [Rhodospira trueperi]
MLTQDFETAWDTYLRAGPWFPAPPPPVTPRRVAGLAEVLETEDIAAVVLDAYGVLHTGSEALPGAREAIADVRRRGLRLCVLTNDVTHEPAGVAAGLHRRGLDIRPDEVVSGRDLLPEALAAVGDGAGWGVIAIHPRDIAARFPALRIVEDLTAHPPSAWDDLQGFVLVDCFHWTPDDLDVFRAILRRCPRPLIIPNPDVACPYDGEITLEPGALGLAAVRDHGVDVHFLGKPFPALYGRLKDRFPDVAAERLLMVGDSPHTDILGARGGGLRCLFVESGLLAGQDSLARFAESDLWPDYLAAGV